MSRSVPLLAAVVLTLVVAIAPTSAAHGAPTPPSWVTRLLHDYNDDWGGHAGGRDGHDLIALDLQERYDATRAMDTVVFRLYVAGGFASDARPTLRDVVTFTGPAGLRSYEFRTADNEHYTGTFDEVLGPAPVLDIQGQPDGSRRTIEGVLFLSASESDAAALHIGDVLRDFAVEGYAGDAAADHMVGGYTEDGVRHDEIQEPEKSDSLSYRRPTYPLKGPSMYLDGTAPETAAAPGSFPWTLHNRVGAQQRVTLAVVPPGPADATFEGVDGDPPSITLAARADRTIGVHLERAGHSAGGVLTLAYTSDLGGHGTTTIQVSEGTSTTSGKSPGPDVLLATLVVAYVAWRRGGAL